MVACVSIFSGAGGLDIGATQAGAKIVACIENDHDSAETLRLNSTSISAEILEKDIQHVSFSQWNDSTDRILIGGPPCQPFSKNGYWVKNDNRLMASDPRNMLGQFLRAVSEMRPNGFLFENVDSILHPTNVDAFNAFVSGAEGLGYRCTIYRANSADYGVPQKRKRVFVFGIRDAKARIPCPEQTHSDPCKPELMNGYAPYVGVGPFISAYAGSSFREAQEDPSGGTYFNELRQVPPGKNYIALSKLKNYKGWPAPGLVDTHLS